MQNEEDRVLQEEYAEACRIIVAADTCFTQHVMCDHGQPKTTGIEHYKRCPLQQGKGCLNKSSTALAWLQEHIDKKEDEDELGALGPQEVKVLDLEEDRPILCDPEDPRVAELIGATVLASDAYGTVKENRGVKTVLKSLAVGERCPFCTTINRFTFIRKVKTVSPPPVVYKTVEQLEKDLSMVPGTLRIGMEPSKGE